MIYKLQILDKDKEVIGEYKGIPIEASEIIEDFLIIRVPNEGINDMVEIIGKMKTVGAFKDKKVYVISEEVEFMKLEKINE